MAWLALDEAMNAHSPLISFDKLVAAYVKLRDQIAEETRQYEERVKGKKQLLEQINSTLLTQLNATGQDSAKTPAGTAYRKRYTSATIADKEMFRRHVIGSEDWDLIDWRANKVAVAKCVEENGDPPPGVNFSQGFDVGVRRPGKDD
jgi:hypothetical protein